jgi:hypothetical protein
MDFSAIFGLVATGAGLLYRPRKKGVKDAWQSAAETYGLVHKPSGIFCGPKLSGWLSGNQLTVGVKFPNSASAETRFRLGMPSLHSRK